MSPLSSELLMEVDRYLSATGMGEKYLGLAAAGNGHIVPRLRRGGDVRLRTATRVREFMRRRLSDEKWLARVQELKGINRATR